MRAVQDPAPRDPASARPASWPVFAYVGAAVMVGLVASWLFVRKNAQAGPSAAPGELDTAPAGSWDPPRRRLCPTPAPDRGPDACMFPLQSWCDDVDRRVACCPKGLVASGRGNMCACPAGGSDQKGVNAWGCAPPSQTDAEARASIQRVLSSAATRIGACASRSQKATLGFELSPEGRALAVRVEPNDAAVAACVAPVLRELRFDAPPNGELRVRYPIEIPGG
jgi:hypothetical protein